MSFRPIPRDWTVNEVTSWINGLEDGLIEYKRNLGKLNGTELFELDSTQLDTLGVFKCGHQEAILDSISLLHRTFQLEAGSSDEKAQKTAQNGSLKYATQQLASKCSALQTIRPTNQPLPIGHQLGVNAINSNKLSNQQLELVIAVLTQVRQVCCILAGIIDQSHADYSKFVKIALELSQTALQPLPAWLGIEPITSCCVELCQIADKIQRSQAAQHYPTTETVTIKRDSNNSLGLFLRQRPVDGTLEITGAKEKSHAFGLVKTGDELIAINSQVIVGWSLSNVVQLLKNCGECAELTLKRRSNVRMTIHSRSQSTPEVWLPSDSDRLSINRRRSAGPNVNSGNPNAAHRRKPILSLPPPPPEPYRPKRPHSMDVRAQSVGNLTGSESPNSLMDAAVSMSQASLPTSGGSDMYFKVVYEDPERQNGTNPQCAALPNSSFSSSVDKLIDEQEKNLIKQLESTSMSQSQRSSQVPLNDTTEPSRYSYNYHSRQGSVASGRTGYSTSHSNLSTSSMDNLEGSQQLTSSNIPPPVNSHISKNSQKAVTDSLDSISLIPDTITDSSCYRQSNTPSSNYNSRLNQNYNNSNQQQNMCHNQPSKMTRTTSEPRLISNSSDSLSVLATPSLTGSSSSILRDVLYRKSDQKSNILQNKWTKVWAVLQNNTLYIYNDSKETDSVLDPIILYGQNASIPDNCKRKYSFQLSGSRCNVLLAAESYEKQRRWISALSSASGAYQAIPGNISVHKEVQKSINLNPSYPTRRDILPSTKRSMSVENISRKINAINIDVLRSSSSSSPPSIKPEVAMRPKSFEEQKLLRPKSLLSTISSSSQPISTARNIENQASNNSNSFPKRENTSETRHDKTGADKKDNRRSFYRETDF